MSLPTIQTAEDARRLRLLHLPALRLPCPVCGFRQEWPVPDERRLAVDEEPPGWAYVRCRLQLCSALSTLYLVALPGLPDPPCLVSLEPPPPHRLVEVRLRDQGGQARWRPFWVTRQVGARVWGLALLDADDDYHVAALVTTALLGGEPGCWRHTLEGERVPPHMIEVLIPGGPEARYRPLVVTRRPTDRQVHGLIVWDASDTDQPAAAAHAEAQRGLDGVWRLVVPPQIRPAPPPEQADTDTDTEPEQGEEGGA
jgi:hypothetical protein